MVTGSGFHKVGVPVTNLECGSQSMYWSTECSYDEVYSIIPAK